MNKNVILGAIVLALIALMVTMNKKSFMSPQTEYCCGV